MGKSHLPNDSQKRVGMGLGSFDLFPRDPKEASFFSSTVIQRHDSVKIPLDLKSFQSKFCFNPWPMRISVQLHHWDSDFCNRDIGYSLDYAYVGTDTSEYVCSLDKPLRRHCRYLVCTELGFFLSRLSSPAKICYKTIQQGKAIGRTIWGPRMR